MTRLFVALFLLLSSCGQVRPCKFQVGDTVRTITGEVFVVKQAQPGHTGMRNSEPRYVLTVGTGWRVGVDGGGILLRRGSYIMAESEIVGVVK